LLRSVGSIQSRLMCRAHSGARRWRPQAVAASIAIVSLGIGALIWFVLLSTPTYATAIGEQRFIRLQDGSTVELNSRSRLSVHFSKHERDVKLLEGQALFQVTKDAARPFVVASGDTTVRAVGTQFDVYKKENGTTVTVIEGRVAILTEHRITDAESLASTVDGRARAAPAAFPGSGGGQAPGILLSAGEQVTVTPKAVQMTERANVARATAWTEHQLLFEATSLTDVAHEFNRYNKRQLIVDAPQLDIFHISGVFSSTDPESLIRFLRERPGLRIVETDTEILIERNN
jgi:transmembrane sensor